MKIPRIVYIAVFTLIACCLYTLPGYAQITETYCSTDVPVFIPDSGTVTSDLNVRPPTAGEITNVILKLQIDHTYRSDLDVSLISPDMTTIDLFSNVGGEGEDFGDECFPMPNFILDDSAADPVTDFSTGDSPVQTYIPEEPLSTYDGEEQAGIWTLSIFDGFDEDEGFLNCWCLEITSIETIRNVPTLSEWGLIAMAGILGIVGFMVMRRRKVTA